MKGHGKEGIPVRQLSLEKRNKACCLRVFANRVWLYHFGRGIVTTANDFGANGQRPSHPELLDHLAGFLIQSDWQTMALHRLILLSNTYRQFSEPTSRGLADSIDPNNSLLWHFPMHRLSAEEIRDSMLVASGQLNTEMGGPGVILQVHQDLVKQLYKPSQWEVTKSVQERMNRSVYLFAKRNLRLPFMEVFDQPAAQTSCSSRQQSTHAPQALELLNGDIANPLAASFAQRLNREAGDNTLAQIETAFMLALGRQPTDLEQQLAASFLEKESLNEFALAIFNLNAFLNVR